MNKGWLELESDPGLFTLLLEDFGVKGVQVEEIYDLQKPFEGITYGFIFLFRWIEERRSRRKTTTDNESFVTDENIVNSIFFAKQVIPNSCATHSLLSILLNCEKVNLGETLSDLKQYCKHMNPENKGHAIGNIPELARAHNSHARKEASYLPEKQQGISVRTREAFHFVSYVPIHGRLFELDGLKPYPIDHGPWNNNEAWTQKFRKVISERLGMATGGEPYHDIRFNLMAVVPDKVSLYEQKLSTLKTNRNIVLEALQQMIKTGSSNITTADKEKCLAVVKKHAPEVAVTTIAMETEESTNEKEAVLDGRKVVEVTKIKDEIESRTKVIKQTQLEMKVIKSDPSAIVKAEAESDSNTLSETKTDKVTSEKVNLTAVQVKEDDESVPVAMEIETKTVTTDSSVPVSVSSSTDLTKPLTIETKFTTSPGPSSESTDTASEVGSCFSSPSSSTVGNSTQNSPNVPITDKALDGSFLKTEVEGSGRSRTKLHSQHGFRPKDLIALLKNVENEIKQCEMKLEDEQEKMRKYKIDNCRRTHNYDQFLCTFISMLAEQGHLGDLVQQHSFIKKRVPGHMRKLSKLSQVVKKKKTKPKKRK